MAEDVPSFRDMIRAVSVRWLKNGLAQKILYAFGLHLDLIGDAAIDGLRKQFPLSPDSADSLGAIGRSRKIARGPTEPDASYASRLIPWLDAHRTRGNPYTLLQQWYAYWQPSPLTATLVYESGKTFTLAADGTITEGSGPPWDTDAAHWARWWLVVDWPGTIGGDGLWLDAGTWDDGGIWDYDLSASAANNLRAIPNDWNAAHCIGYVVVRAPDVELWDFPPGLWSDAGVWGGGTGDPLIILRADGF